VSWIEDQLAEFGPKLAVQCTSGNRSYDDFLERINAYAKQIKTAVPAGPFVIGISLKDTLDSLAAILAVARLRHVALPLAQELATAELESQLKISGGAFLLQDDGLRSVSEPSAAPVLLQQLAKRQHAGLILFSSGTSGEPKGMLHDLDVLLDRYKTVKPRNDRTVQLLLSDHIGGLDSAFRTLFAGSTMIVADARSPDAVAAAIESGKATILPASPTFLNLMRMANVFAKHDCSSLEVIAYGAEPMPQQLLAELCQHLPKVSFQQKVGTSETGAIRIKSRRNDSLFFEIKDDGVEWQIVDEELWLKTSSRILGYLNADESSLEAGGWYRTGDLVEEEAGFIRIVGRSSGMINVGGQKVHPAEIEQVISEIEGILACSVFAKPAPITGDLIACTIVTNDDASLRDWKRRIRNHSRGRLAPWKIPAVIELNDQLEVNERMKRRL